MNAKQLDAIAQRYATLRIALIGDFCLDRYLEIDPDRGETSIETGLPVHNVVRVRSQPGAAGTILNNLAALGVGTIYPVGFAGDDGEGFELKRALAALPGVRLDHFMVTPERRTFTYCKPLIVRPREAPVELSRLDSKNWTPSPTTVTDTLAASVRALWGQVDAVILMDQVDVEETGVVNGTVLAAIRQAVAADPARLVIADSRRSLRGYPPVTLKMNGAEMAALLDTALPESAEAAQRQALSLAQRHGRPVIVTLAERGMVGAEPQGAAAHQPAWPVRGEIDIVGAGDAVTANLTAAIASGANLIEAMQLANAAASIVIHQLGTTGTASVPQLRSLVVSAEDRQ
jgi:rfaE bifunctional protein kinase chain/domain